MSKFLKTMLAGLAAVALLATQTNAQQLNNMTYTFSQVGNDVVMNASGGFNLGGQGPAGTLSNTGFFGVFSTSPSSQEPSQFLLASIAAASSYKSYNFRVSVPVDDFFGNPAGRASEVGSGTNGFSLYGEGDSYTDLAFYTPSDYGSGNLLTSSITFTNSTLANLGLEVGMQRTFEYFAQGEGPLGSALGTITLAAVPEPSALLLVGSVAGAGLVRRRRR